MDEYLIVSQVQESFNQIYGSDDDNASSSEEDSSSGKIANFAEEIVPSYNNKIFKSHFRLNIETFNKLCQLIHNSRNLEIHRGRPEVHIEKQVMIALWFFGNREPFRTISDRFNCAKSTTWKIVNEFSSTMLTLNVSNSIVKWPSASERNATKSFYALKHRFRGVIGSVDGTHIPIIAPGNHPNSYVNRKGFHSLLLQAVCDYKLKFIHFYTGEAGSLHDARVFTRSKLKQKIESGEFEISADEHMLGDSAYKLEKFLLVPFKNNGRLADEEIIYNTVHSKCRVDIERAFGLLKGRFRRLKLVETNRTEMIPLFIGTCVILHNLCVESDDQIDPDDVQTNDDTPAIEDDEQPANYAESSSSDDEQDQHLSEGQRKRAQIINYLF